MPANARSRQKREAAASAEHPTDVQAAAEVQQTELQRPVMKFMPGKISCQKYEQRVDNCTKEQLSLLLTSPEYQQWQGRQLTKSSSWTLPSKALFGLSLLVAIPLVLLASYYLTSSSQQVKLTSMSALIWLVQDHA